MRGALKFLFVLPVGALIKDASLGVDIFYANFRMLEISREIYRTERVCNFTTGIKGKERLKQ